MHAFIISFTLFLGVALGLPFYMAQNNPYSVDRVHGCSDGCYEDWKADTGGVVAVLDAQIAARAEAGPAELGREAYAGCAACHGTRGEGGIGPVLAGQSAPAVTLMLEQYKAGETRGKQSNLMWGQAAALSDRDIDNLAAYIETL